MDIKKECNNPVLHTLAIYRFIKEHPECLDANYMHCFGYYDNLMIAGLINERIINKRTKLIPNRKRNKK